MSCYLPLVQRWRKPRKETRDVPLRPAPPPEPSKQPEEGVQVHALRDRKGVTLSQGRGEFPHQVFLNIRHDHPTLCLEDVAYQRLHLEHTHQTRADLLYDQSTNLDRYDTGVVSLGLPLGISSLKLTSRSRKVKTRKTNGHVSDGEVVSRRTEPSGGWRVPSIHVENNNGGARSEDPAVRRSSLPRKAKIPSAYQMPATRPLSVDAELLLKSAHKSHPLLDAFAPAAPSVDFTPLPRFAALTSPRSYMEAGERSSSGNSSGSDLTWDGSPPPGSPPPPEDLHPALRGRGQAEVALVTRGPPPKHLLPKKLKPSPSQKLHPLVVLTPEIRKGKTSFSKVILCIFW